MRRILAHHYADRAVRIHVVRAALRIVFQDEERRVVPERGVRDRLHCPAHRQIVVCHGSFRRRAARRRSRRMIVGQPQHDEVRHRVLAGLFIHNPPRQMLLEDVFPHLVRHPQVEVRSLRRKVPHQLRLGRPVCLDQRDRPRPLVHAAAPHIRQRLARLHLVARRARNTFEHRPLPRVGLRARPALRVAKGGRDELAEVVERHAMPGQITPEIAARRLVHVRNMLLKRQPLAHHAFKVIAMLPTAVVELPRPLEVIRADGRVRPHMPVARDLG